MFFLSIFTAIYYICVYTHFVTSPLFCLYFLFYFYHRCMTNGSKTQKKSFLPNLDPIARVWVLSSGVENIGLQQFLLSNLYLFESILSGMVWIDKLHKYIKVNCFNVYQENRKKTLSHFAGRTRGLYSFQE